MIGQAEALEQTPGQAPTGVVVRSQDGQSQTLPCTDVVIAAGPWSSDLAYKLLGKSLKKRFIIEGTRAHSVRHPLLEYDTGKVTLRTDRRPHREASIRTRALHGPRLRRRPRRTGTLLPP